MGKTELPKLTQKEFDERVQKLIDQGKDLTLKNIHPEFYNQYKKDVTFNYFSVLLAIFLFLAVLLYSRLYAV